MYCIIFINLLALAKDIKNWWVFKATYFKPRTTFSVFSQLQPPLDGFTKLKMSDMGVQSLKEHIGCFSLLTYRIKCQILFTFLSTSG